MQLDNIIYGDRIVKVFQSPFCSSVTFYIRINNAALIDGGFSLFLYNWIYLTTPYILMSDIENVFGNGQRYYTVSIDGSSEFSHTVYTNEIFKYIANHER